MANLAPEEKKSEYITKKKRKRKFGPASGLGKKDSIVFVTDDKIFEITTPKDMKSGGRVNLRGGGCAKRGVKKNAYGKNS